MLGAGVLSIECFGFWVTGLVFSPSAWDENVAEDLQKFESQTIGKATEEMTKAVAKGLEGVVNGLGHGIAACLSGMV